MEPLGSSSQVPEVQAASASSNASLSGTDAKVHAQGSRLNPLHSSTKSIKAKVEEFPPGFVPDMLIVPNHTNAHELLKGKPDGTFLITVTGSKEDKAYCLHHVKDGIPDTIIFHERTWLTQLPDDMRFKSTFHRLKWFYENNPAMFKYPLPVGYLKVSMDQANILLKNSPAGTYIVRDSSIPGRYSLDHKREDGTIAHARILQDEGGFYFEDTAHDKHSSISSLVKLYLGKPWEAPQGAPHGYVKVDANEAEELLRACPEGTFIVRDSSAAGFYTMTIKDNTGGVYHERILKDAGGYYFGNDLSSYRGPDISSSIRSHALRYNLRPLIPGSVKT